MTASSVFWRRNQHRWRLQIETWKQKQRKGADCHLVHGQTCILPPHPHPTPPPGGWFQMSSVVLSRVFSLLVTGSSAQATVKRDGEPATTIDVFHGELSVVCVNLGGNPHPWPRSRPLAEGT